MILTHVYLVDATVLVGANNFVSVKKILVGVNLVIATDLHGSQLIDHHKRRP